MVCDQVRLDLFVGSGMVATAWQVVQSNRWLGGAYVVSDICINILV